MQRRTALSLLGGSLTAALAGCLGGDGGDGGDGDGSVIAGNDEFRGESQEGGFVWFGQPEEETAREEGLSLAPSENIPEPVVVDAELNDDGTWQSTNIDFPPLSLGVADVNPEITVPDGLSGEFNEDDGLLTVTGEVTATVESGGEEKSLSVPLNATTKQSGDLEGSFEIQEDSIHTTIVDNESVVEDTFGDALVDGALNLPGEFEGDNWFSLPLVIEPVE